MYCSFASIGHADVFTVSSYCLQSLHLPSVSVCNILVARSLVMPDLVVLLFHFQSLLSDLPSTAIGTRLLR